MSNKKRIFYICVPLLVVSMISVLLLSGCSYFRDYGLNRTASSLQHRQTNDFYIKGDYEFKSILFKSADESLIISVQHPLHPLPSPERFISQIEFNLSEIEADSVIIKEVSLVHLDAKGVLVKPTKIRTIPDKSFNQTQFYGKFYTRKSLTKKLNESVHILFIYQGKEYEVNFSEEVRLVKRWNKIIAYLGS